MNHCHLCFFLKETDLLIPVVVLTMWWAWIFLQSVFTHVQVVTEPEEGGGITAAMTPIWTGHTTQPHGSNRGIHPYYMESKYLVLKWWLGNVEKGCDEIKRLQTNRNKATTKSKVQTCDCYSIVLLSLTDTYWYFRIF